jgi:flagellar hook-length control protein FliK
MITLQASISPTPAANAAHGDTSGAETATGPDFAALMAGMLAVSSNPGAAAVTDANAADANADTEHGAQEQAASAGNGAAAAIESALAIERASALSAAAPVNAAAAALFPAQAPASTAATGGFPPPAAANAAAAADFPAPIRGQSSVAPVDLPHSDTSPARTNAETPRAGSPITEFHAPPRPAASAAASAAAAAAAEEPKAMALPPDGSAHGSVHPSDLPPLAPQASDSAQPARQPEFQALQPASRAAEMPVAPAAHSPRIDAPLGSARWREDLAAHITVIVRNAASEAEIRVTPPELGPIHARISVDNGIASVTLSAPVPETRDALEASLATLRERLAESGLALGEASVSDGRASRDAPGSERSPRAADAVNLSDPRLPAEAVRRLRLDGLVDLYA